MPFSLRLDPQTEAKIRRLAAASGQSKSSVVREAVAQYTVDNRSGRSGSRSAFERLGSFVGRVRTGRGHLSKDTHAKYREALRRKQRARRSR
jgi:hypothetical protein